MLASGGFPRSWREAEYCDDPVHNAIVPSVWQTRVSSRPYDGSPSTAASVRRCQGEQCSEVAGILSTWVRGYFGNLFSILITISHCLLTCRTRIIPGPEELRRTLRKHLAIRGGKDSVDVKFATIFLLIRPRLIAPAWLWWRPEKMIRATSLTRILVDYRGARR
jgi:hypothetical protein